MSVTVVNIHEAKTHLSRLLSQVTDGDEVIIAKNGVPLAKLVSLVKPQPRKPGRFLGQIQDASDSLLQPLTPEELDLWEKGFPGNPLSQTISEAKS